MAAILAASLLVGVIAVIAVAPAGSATPSKVRIRVGFHSGSGEPFFGGRVRSKRTACMRNRKVRIYKQLNRPGRRHRVRTGRSDSRGFYQIEMFKRMKTAGYFAAAKAKPGCEAAHSKVIAVGQRGPGGLGPGGSG